MARVGFNHYYQFGSFNQVTNQSVGVAVTGTNTYTSPITDISQQHNVGLDVRFAGTMTGTFTVNCSNDGIVFNSLTFTPPLAQPAGSNLQYLVDLNQVPFRYLQVSYVNASGSGTIISILMSKDLGG